MSENIWEACQTGDVEEIKKFLDSKDEQEEDEQATPLHMLAGLGHLEGVKFLVENDAKVAVTDCNGWLPSHAAAQGGHLEIMKVLFEKGCDPTALDEDGAGHVHRAACAKSADCLQFLIDSHGGDVTKARTDGNTPAHNAARFGSIACLKLCAEKGADLTVKDEEGLTVMHAALTGGNSECVKLIAEKGEDPCAALPDGTPAILAAASGNASADLFSFLIEKGVDINTADEESGEHAGLLFNAGAEGALEAVKVLVDKGIDIHKRNPDGLDMAHYAIMSGMDGAEVFKYLASKGAKIQEVDEEGKSAIHSAVQEGDVSILKFLVEEMKIDPSVKMNNFGGTPLHTAPGGDPEGVKYLISKGGNVNAKTEDGKTPAHFAVIFSNAEALKLLVEAGADVNAKDDDDLSPTTMVDEMDEEDSAPFKEALKAPVKKLPTPRSPSRPGSARLPTPRQPPTKPMKEWTVDDCVLFLKAECRLGQHEPKFREKEMTGEGLSGMTPEKLKEELGVAEEAECTKIMESIEKFKNK